LLICSDTLRQNLSDNEIDEILQESSGSENACQNLLKIVNVNSQSRDNVNNIVVMEVINNQKVITPIPIVDTKQAENKSSSKFNPLWLLLPLLLLFIGGLAWFSVNNTLNFKNLFGFSNRQVAVEDTITFLNKNKDSLDLAKANTIITKEFETEKLEENFPEQKDDFATTPKSIEKEEIKTKSGSNSFAKKSILKISTKNNSSSANNKGEVSFPNTSSKNLDIANEEQNYNALIQQREKWTTIKNDLQGTLSSGNAAAAEKLKNSEKVLERIEEKIRESAKKLGRN
jgi:hypothetical protein